MYAWSSGWSQWINSNGVEVDGLHEALLDIWLNLYWKFKLIQRDCHCSTQAVGSGYSLKTSSLCLAKIWNRSWTTFWRTELDYICSFPLVFFPYFSPSLALIGRSYTSVASSWSGWHCVGTTWARQCGALGRVCICGERKWLQNILDLYLLWWKSS